ncbi:MAG: AIR synthase-related protein [Nanoarchaeota archaeon]
MKSDYQSSGVNIELGDEVSKVLYTAAKQTWKNRQGRIGEVVEIFEDFSGLRAIKVGGLPTDTYMNLSFDGVGTKVELAERIAKHDTVAYDLFAMVCDDAVVRGAEPVLVGSILDVKKLGDDNNSYLNFIKQLAVGYINAAKEANVAIVNGEVAELGARVQGYGAFNYNWGAGVVWFARKSRMLTGYEIKESDKMVGLREHGFRSNGLSLVRKILKAAHGEEWHLEKYNGVNLAEAALHPSRIYSGTVVDMLGSLDREAKAEIHGIAHITGGGLPGKLGRVLKPTSLGAYVDPFEPCDLMKYCQEKGNVADAEAYRTWNMGQGMIIITPDPDTVINLATQHGIESKIMGEITKQAGITIRNKGINAYAEKELCFEFL